MTLSEPVAAAPGRPSSPWRLGAYKIPLLLAAPAALLYLVLFIVPFGNLLLFSFYDYSRLAGIIKTISLKNYERFWLDPYYLEIVFRTFRISIMATIGSFQVFAAAFILTGGGPSNATMFYVYYLFNRAFVYFNMGYASAMAWLWETGQIVAGTVDGVLLVWTPCAGGGDAALIRTLASGMEPIVETAKQWHARRATLPSVHGESTRALQTASG